MTTQTQTQREEAEAAAAAARLIAELVAAYGGTTYGPGPLLIIDEEWGRSESSTEPE